MNGERAQVIKFGLILIAIIVLGGFLTTRPLPAKYQGIDLDKFQKALTHHRYAAASKQLEAAAKSPKISDFKKNEIASAWDALGSYYANDNRFADAERAYRKSLEFSPDNAGALNDLGYLYADEGVKLDESEQMIKRALKQAPNDASTIDSLGWVYYRKGDYVSAKEKLIAAAKSMPDSAEIRYHLGKVYLALGDSDGATIELGKAAALDPRYREKVDFPHKKPGSNKIP